MTFPPLGSAMRVSGRTHRFYTLHLSDAGPVVVERTKRFFEASRKVEIPATARVVGLFSEIGHGLPDQMKADFKGTLDEIAALSPRVTP